MDYYTNKRNAYGIIRKMLLEENKTPEEIALKIANLYGFGENFTQKYIELVIKGGKSGKKS